MGSSLVASAAGWLRGPGRRREWRRRVLRKSLAGVCAAVAVVGLAAVARGPGEPLVPVVVAVRPLAVGEVVTPAAVREVPWPARLVPEGAVRQVGQVLGQALASPVGAGESLTRSRFSTTSLLAGRPSDEVAVHVPLPDTGVVGMLSAGDRVDLLAPDHAIARGVLVLRVDRSFHTDFGAPLAGEGSSAGYAMEGSGIVVAAGEAVAADLARVADDATGRPTVEVVLRRP